MKSKRSKRHRATKRARRHREGIGSNAAPPEAWLADDGIHMLLPGVATPELLEKLSRNLQEQLRRSPLWAELIETHGQERAEQIVQQCRAKLA